METLTSINAIRIKIAEWLTTPITSSTNYWSIIHLFSGFFIVMYFLRYNVFKKLGNFATWILMFILLVIYECFECYLGMPYFAVETKADIISDIIIGMIGGFISWRIFK